MKKYIPNFLTLFRVFLVPVFFCLLYYSQIPYHYIWATFVFIIASITDIYDGRLARKYGVISNFGKIMDPLADKLLTLLALYALASQPLNMMSIYVFYIILFREVFITVLRQIHVRKKVYIAANVWGKVKTTFQMTGIIASLVYYSLLFPFMPNLHVKFQFWFGIFFWIVAVITILSGISYLFPQKQLENK
ncbi:MAG: CDP-diacylglycerol--glycerol-3-phosphate 3-phosphatidyltransferase [Candidatus Tenebribacter davisii]|jgi:CDP-diacylglycerol--glycerol-3-phosphate 3-phosphatidyltransferase|nr:CDP-diacylglycerol--glycerol-3-phosphate 3-phosphatidyltransferase [Candidatus Tenebribacter davisii]